MLSRLLRTRNEQTEMQAHLTHRNSAMDISEQRRLPVQIADSPSYYSPIVPVTVSVPLTQNAKFSDPGPTSASESDRAGSAILDKLSRTETDSPEQGRNSAKSRPVSADSRASRGMGRQAEDDPPVVFIVDKAPARMGQSGPDACSYALQNSQANCFYLQFGIRS